jgi:hypothetical protein
LAILKRPDICRVNGIRTIPFQLGCGDQPTQRTAELRGREGSVSIGGLFGRVPNKRFRSHAMERTYDTVCPTNALSDQKFQPLNRFAIN